MAKELRLDKIGFWSEAKLDIIEKYAVTYSTILSKKGFYHVYIDAFAGAGEHESKTTGGPVPGSPVKALEVQPAFKEYFFIDLDERKVRHLEALAHDREDVHVYHGDCNDVLLKDILPRVRWKDFRRGLCILDPYGLHLDWKVTERIGRMRSVEIFLNFPVHDMNRNILWRVPEDVAPEQAQRMDRFWGDKSWHEVAYAESPQLRLDGRKEFVKQPEKVIVKAFRERLKRVAGFKYVPRPIAMVNKRNAPLYYLFFAAHVPEARKIVNDIFRKHERGMLADGR